MRKLIVSLEHDADAGSLSNAVRMLRGVEDVLISDDVMTPLGVGTPVNTAVGGEWTQEGVPDGWVCTAGKKAQCTNQATWWKGALGDGSGRCDECKQETT